jgi:hypothetical protein
MVQFLLSLIHFFLFFLVYSLPPSKQTFHFSQSQDPVLANVYFNCYSASPMQNGTKESPYLDFYQIEKESFSDAFLTFFLLNQSCTFKYTLDRQIGCLSLSIVGSDNLLEMQKTVQMSSTGSDRGFEVSLKNFTIV